jgi:hypothetical protein
MIREVFLRLAVAGACASACTAQGLSDPRALAQPDLAYFRCKVQPVLAKSCAAFLCHGDGRRFFRVFARNRLRSAGTEADRNAPLRAEELQANYDAARAFIDPGDPDHSFLLMKPLDASAGGWFHRGAQIFGQGNVFASQQDPDYQTLSGWVRGAQGDPTCVEPGSSQ